MALSSAEPTILDGSWLVVVRTAVVCALSGGSRYSGLDRGPVRAATHPTRAEHGKWSESWPQQAKAGRAYGLNGLHAFVYTVD